MDSTTDRPLEILQVASEVTGFAKSGGLADVAKALPMALRDQGHKVRVVMPYYRNLEHKEKVHALVALDLVVQEHYSISFRVMRTTLQGVEVLLIDCPRYFDRAGLYTQHNQAYSDNGERFSFFCLAVAHMCLELDIKPDILHCHDWHTCALPILLKTRFAWHPNFQNTRSVLTIHNAAFQGVYQRREVSLLPELCHVSDPMQLNSEDEVNLLKVGVVYADKVNTVSPNYAQELLTRLGSHGMDHVFRHRQADFCGILNGCDYNDWDPTHDPLIPFNYTPDQIEGKLQCKTTLQQQLDLPVEKLPLFGMVSRLTDQKGLDYLVPALDEFLQHNVQVVIQGSGEALYTRALEELARRYPDNFRFHNGYSETRAHLIEAGSDFFLMPSLFEPCGLNQMYSLAYGTLPIVRAVGGLVDTVWDYDEDPDRATGFVFHQHESQALLHKMRRALLLYTEQPGQIQQLQQRAMHTRFSWQQAGEEYLNLYRQALQH